MNYMLLILVWNIFVLLVYASDKIKAKRATRRIRESTLLLLSFLLGGYGAMFGMVLFNHKTSKMKFRIFVPLCTAFQTVIYVYFTKVSSLDNILKMAENITAYL